jgi:hypothetical protein
MVEALRDWSRGGHAAPLLVVVWAARAGKQQEVGAAA